MTKIPDCSVKLPAATIRTISPSIISRTVALVALLPTERETRLDNLITGRTEVDPHDIDDGKGDFC